tara:strand:- start:19133 stop:19579 length:447 start_codon:yes stop_codon:yes gene_type:complete
MGHLRKQIGALAVSRVTGLATTGANVFQNRVTPIAASQLPALSVSIGDETIQRMSMGTPRRLERGPQIHFDLITAEGDTSADTLSDMLEEVEAALAPGSWMDALLFDIVPVAISEIYDGAGTKIAGQIRITYQAEYQTAEGAPGTALS